MYIRWSLGVTTVVVKSSVTLLLLPAWVRWAAL